MLFYFFASLIPDGIAIQFYFENLIEFIQLLCVGAELT